MHNVCLDKSGFKKKRQFVFSHYATSNMFVVGNVNVHAIHTNTLHNIHRSTSNLAQCLQISMDSRHWTIRHETHEALADTVGVRAS